MYSASEGEMMKKKLPTKTMVLIFVLLNILALVAMMAIPKVYTTTVAVAVPQKYVGTELKPLVDVRASCLIINSLWNAYKGNKSTIPLVRFGLEEGNALLIKGIRADILDENTKEVKTFKLKIYVKKDPRVLLKVSRAMVDYLNHQIAQDLKIEQSKTENQIKALEENLVYLKRLRKSLKGKTVATLRFNPAQVDQAIEETIRKIEEFRAYLENLQGYRILGSVYIPQKPLYPRLKYNLILANLLAIGICLLIFLAPYLA